MRSRKLRRGERRVSSPVPTANVSGRFECYSFRQVEVARLRIKSPKHVRFRLSRMYLDRSASLRNILLRWQSSHTEEPSWRLFEQPFASDCAFDVLRVHRTSTLVHALKSTSNAIGEIRYLAWEVLTVGT